MREEEKEEQYGDYAVYDLKGSYHFIGIGGISMSAIAQILKEEGNTVTGSDRANSRQVEILREKGIDVTIGHDISKIAKADTIVYTAAIPEDDEELVEAKRLNKEMYERAEFLGIIIRMYENSIAVAGTHRKNNNNIYDI